MDLDKVIVSGKLTVGRATITLNYTTLRQMLDKIEEVLELVESPVEVGHGETPPDGYEQTREHLATFIGRPPAWRKVEQAIDRLCEFCGKPMLAGDTVYQHAVEPDRGAKMCFRCFLELKPNG